MIASRYGRAFLLYSKCHVEFNSSKKFTPATATTLRKLQLQKRCYLLTLCSLENDIDAFISFYRAEFQASVTPKLHMLEDHVSDFIREWGVGVGMLGEQGIESIHTIFNSLERTYNSMVNKDQRLKSMVMEHHRQISPENIARRPSPPPKRWKSDTDSV